MRNRDVMIMLNFGKEIKELRKGKRMTLEAFGGAVGVSGKTVFRWEKGVCVPRLDMLDKMCKKFSLPENYFYSSAGKAENTKTLAKSGEKPLCLLSGSGGNRGNKARHMHFIDDEKAAQILIEGFRKLSDPKKNQLIGFMTMLKYK